MMDILIFATNVTGADEVSRLSPLLTAVPAITDWNFDLEDCDRILRVVSQNIPGSFVELLMQNAGFRCVELVY
jgi:hypothetical protein